MSLRYLTDTFHAQLLKSIPANAERYVSTTPWLDNFAGATKYWRETGLDVPMLPRLVVSDQPQDDSKNSEILYAALKRLTPVQATDPRLWAYLTHVTYWEYVVTRWGKSKAEVIQDRFFVRRRGIGSLARNGIARLWWSGYLTHDQKRADPYELTKVLFIKQDIHTGLLERNLGKSLSIRRAALDYFKIHAAKIEQIGKWSKLVQRIVLDLNTAGGVYLLDALEPPQIHEIMDASFAEVAA